LKQCFTLIEVMIVILILAVAGTVIGIRIDKALEEKQFQTAADRLYCELESCRHLAMNMQADWTVSLEKKKDRFIFMRASPETGRSATFEWAAPCQLLWNARPAERIVFQFSSTGKIAPAGLLELVGKTRRVQWNLPQLFHAAEGSDGALPRPDFSLKEVR
jgi:prepilin-type N-terminal cleavage/methylation domain-containing protein